MDDKALFEVVLKDGQKFNALMDVGYWSAKNDFWLYCTVLGQNVSILLDDIASVKYAGGIAYDTETRKHVGGGSYDYFETAMPPVLRFPFKKAPENEDLEWPVIGKYENTYVGDALFRQVSWSYREYVTSDDGEATDRIYHRFTTYMTEDNYRKLIAQWARELAERNISSCNN